MKLARTLVALWANLGVVLLALMAVAAFGLFITVIFDEGYWPLGVLFIFVSSSFGARILMDKLPEDPSSSSDSDSAVRRPNPFPGITPLDRK